MPRIDAHVHVAPSRAETSVVDLERHCRTHGLYRVVLVQTTPAIDETRILLELAEESERVAGLVGWIDFESRETPRLIAELSGHARFVAVRPDIDQVADDAWILDPKLHPTFQALVEHQVALELPAQPRHLESILELLDRFPLRILLDRCAAPPLDPDWAGAPRWQNEMQALSSHRNVYCKLSGLADDQDWRATHLGPWIDTILELFQAHRVIWGSDWPDVFDHGGVERWMQATERLLHSCTDAERNAIMGDNAARFYRLRPLASA